MSEGFLLVNKPSGPTSHDVIDILRRVAGIKRIGHAGTLDPFAEGLLIVGVGRTATRQLDRFLKLDKEYLATLKLGATSDTYDPEGKIRIKNKVSSIKLEQIEQVLNKFKGVIEQLPPMYSAKKIKGKKLYQLARQGKEIQRLPVKIEIKKLELIKYDWPLLELACLVSSGTYIRSLAHDIGLALKTGAYLEALQRISIGEHKLSEAVELSAINEENWEKYLRTLPEA